MKYSKWMSGETKEVKWRSQKLRQDLYEQVQRTEKNGTTTWRLQLVKGGNQEDQTRTSSRRYVENRHSTWRTGKRNGKTLNELSIRKTFSRNQPNTRLQFFVVFVAVELGSVVWENCFQISRDINFFYVVLNTYHLIHIENKTSVIIQKSLECQVQKVTPLTSPAHGDTAAN